MKKNDWLILISTALFSFLFYKQAQGINYLIFDINLTILLMVRNIRAFKEPSLLIATTGTLLSGLAVSLHGTGYAVFANLISLCLLAAFSIYPASSVIMAFIFSIFSYASAPIFMVINFIRFRRRNDQAGKKSNSLTYYILPLIVVFVFFNLYRSSNLVFDNYVSFINFDFISFGWILFTIAGLILMYGFFQYRVLPEIYNEAQALPENLTNKIVESDKIKIFKEYKAGITLFLMLNLLVLLVNFVDISTLFLHQLPDGISYSDMVHQGVGSLIFSIILAIGLIIYYFRGSLNFFEKSNSIKFTAYLWIAQNLFLLFTTAWKNQLYIAEFSLTWKRIGVDIWLLLAAGGLLITIAKIYKAKNVFYMAGKNVWLLYLVLVAGCLFNWDLIITEFNLKRAESNKKPLDREYLLSLGAENLPLLYRSHIFLAERCITRDTFDNIFKKLDLKRGIFFYKQSNTDWRSWNYDESKAYEYVKLTDPN